MLTCKPTVRIQRFTPALMRLLVVLEDLARVPSDGIPDPLVITSANDSTHTTGSQHYRDTALDLRTHSFASEGAVLRFQALLQGKLGPQFTVLREGAGTPQAHLHVQVRKGHTYVPV